MKKVPATILYLNLAFTLILQTSAAYADGWRSVEKILGRQGLEQGDMLKVTFPRTDLNVTVEGIPLEPGLALTTWFTFKSIEKGTLLRQGFGGQVMVMGDVVLLDQEVPKVLAQLVKNGFEVTAIHNHLLNESPAIKYVHVSGRGSRANLAEAIKDILSFTGTPTGQAAPIPTNMTPVLTPDPSKASGQGWSRVQAFLGEGKTNGKVLEYSFPRAETITEEGMEIPPFMGMATSINFQKVNGLALGEKSLWGMAAGSSLSKYIVAGTGDFVLTAEEVNPVVEALTKNHIIVTAIHSHMLKESPRLFFLHFWALGDAGEVSKGLKAALNEVHLIGTK